MSDKLEQTTETEAPDKWEITANRFVAFIDIMGFKDLVARNSHEEIYSKLEYLNEKKRITVENLHKLVNNEAFVTMFSDSICFFSRNDSPKSLKYILTSTSLFFAQSISSLPMKGAIALGKISVDKNRQIFFGQPIIDAYLLQEEVNYYGVVFHNTVDKYIKEKNFEEGDRYFFEAKTPMKSGKITHNNIDWFSRFPPYKGKDRKESLSDLIKSLKNNVSGKPRIYVDNTEEMMFLCLK